MVDEGLVLRFGHINWGGTLLLCAVIQDDNRGYGPYVAIDVRTGREVNNVQRTRAQIKASHLVYNKWLMRQENPVLKAAEECLDLYSRRSAKGSPDLGRASSWLLAAKLGDKRVRDVALDLLSNDFDMSGEDAVNMAHDILHGTAVANSKNCGS
jgi:hypothetical protein